MCTVHSLQIFHWQITVHPHHIETIQYGISQQQI